MSNKPILDIKHSGFISDDVIGKPLNVRYGVYNSFNKFNLSYQDKSIVRNPFYHPPSIWNNIGTCTMIVALISFLYSPTLITKLYKENSCSVDLCKQIRKEIAISRYHLMDNDKPIPVSIEHCFLVHELLFLAGLEENLEGCGLGCFQNHFPYANSERGQLTNNFLSVLMKGPDNHLRRENANMASSGSISMRKVTDKQNYETENFTSDVNVDKSGKPDPLNKVYTIYQKNVNKKSLNLLIFFMNIIFSTSNDDEILAYYIYSIPHNNGSNEIEIKEINAFSNLPLVSLEEDSRQLAIYHLDSNILILQDKLKPVEEIDPFFSKIYDNIIPIPEKIISSFYSKEIEETFVNIFQKNELPSNILVTELLYGFETLNLYRWNEFVTTYVTGLMMTKWPVKYYLGTLNRKLDIDRMMTDGKFRHFNFFKECFLDSSFSSTTSSGLSLSASSPLAASFTSASSSIDSPSNTSSKLKIYKSPEGRSVFSDSAISSDLLDKDDYIIFSIQIAFSPQVREINNFHKLKPLVKPETFKRLKVQRKAEVYAATANLSKYNEKPEILKFIDESLESWIDQELTYNSVIYHNLIHPDKKVQISTSTALEEPKASRLYNHITTIVRTMDGNQWWFVNNHMVLPLLNVKQFIKILEREYIKSLYFERSDQYNLNRNYLKSIVK
ncbi:hypothetical protein SNEBB_008570, partial [Seison nebaliae]